MIVCDHCGCGGGEDCFRVERIRMIEYRPDIDDRVAWAAGPDRLSVDLCPHCLRAFDVLVGKFLMGKESKCVSP